MPSEVAQLRPKSEPLTDRELADYNAVIVNAEANGFTETAKRMRKVVAQKIAFKCHCFLGSPDGSHTSQCDLRHSEYMQARDAAPSLGTPKTLLEAILRGNTAESIEESVVDFISQKFQPAYFREVPGIQAFWRAITGEPHPDMFTRDILARKAATNPPGSCL